MNNQNNNGYENPYNPYENNENNENQNQRDNPNQQFVDTVDNYKKTARKILGIPKFIKMILNIASYISVPLFAYIILIRYGGMVLNAKYLYFDNAFGEVIAFLCGFIYAVICIIYNGFKIFKKKKIEYLHYSMATLLIISFTIPMFYYEKYTDNEIVYKKYLHSEKVKYEDIKNVTFKIDTFKYYTEAFNEQALEEMKNDKSGTLHYVINIENDPYSNLNSQVTFPARYNTIKNKMVNANKKYVLSDYVEGEGFIDKEVSEQQFNEEVKKYEPYVGTGLESINPDSDTYTPLEKVVIKTLFKIFNVDYNSISK